MSGENDNVMKTAAKLVKEMNQLFDREMLDIENTMYRAYGIGLNELMKTYCSDEKSWNIGRYYQLKELRQEFNNLTVLQKDTSSSSSMSGEHASSAQRVNHAKRR